MKPLIGLNVDVNVQKPTEARIARLYFESIEKAGGLPVLVPPMKKNALNRLIDRLSGVLLIGGRDYSPSLYGQERHQSVETVHPIREDFDMMLAGAALGRDMPVLAICGGLQLVNIVLGGTLIQDLPTALPESAVVHRAKVEQPTDRPVTGQKLTHPVGLLEGTKLRRIYRRATLPRVRTSHHQAIDRPGKGLIASAFAEDGVIEAAEHVALAFVIGVQWHPETDYEGNKRLFRAFVRQAAVNAHATR